MKKKTLLTALLTSLFISNVFAHGVAIIDASTGEYLQLLHSNIDVTINHQIAVVKTTQVFKNISTQPVNVKYAFPLNEEASATSLGWKLRGTWYYARFAPAPQDSSLPQSDPNQTDQDLSDYLGETPLYFNVNDTLPIDSVLIVELTYVQLLPYAFSKVELHYPNDYSLIQPAGPDSVNLKVALSSSKTIKQFDLLSHSGAIITGNSNQSTLTYKELISPAVKDFQVEYELSSDQMGLFSFSTFLQEPSNECDSIGDGFFAFIVEPDPGDSVQVIEKVFTLVIDRSGSMGGNKIMQARDAASFIVNNLNPGDQFNIVDFESSAHSFKLDHVPFNSLTQSQALTYINTITSGGGTNMTESFSVSIPQFSTANPDAANIMIFFTDGYANSGAESILQHVQQLKATHNIDKLQIFTFGIGTSVNEYLLSELATQNDGVFQLIDASNLNQAISDFYLKIRNPVMLNIQMTFDPPIIYETFPEPLPNLYLGQQLIVVGRYGTADSVKVNFTGEKFGNPISLQYDFTLSDSTVESNHFLTKIWAKKKMENLMISYYAAQGSNAEAIKDHVTNISMCYQVISPFTSFVSGYGGGGGTIGLEFDEIADLSENILSVFPNPFNDYTKIQITTPVNVHDFVEIRIYDITGNLVRTFKIFVGESGAYEVVWNGENERGLEMGTGVYFYSVDLAGRQFTGKVMRH